MGEDIRKVRELLASLPDTRGFSVARRRELMSQGAAAVHLPRGIEVAAVDAGGVPAEWVRAQGGREDRVVLYLHGGGYVIGSLASHRQLVAYLARAAGARMLSIAYRLAPEHPFPAAVEDAAAAYRWLRGEAGVDPVHIAIAGDSAGGGLAVATLLALRDAGIRLPACGMCISPWADLTCSSATYETKAATDPMIPREEIEEFASLYLGGADPRTPLASPVFADLTGLPPLLIQVGTEEVLLDDARALDRRARACGVDSTLEVWQDMIHVWHAFSPMLQEGRAAIARMGEYYRAHAG
jgi:epsilon-lactone hydrolase